MAHNELTLDSNIIDVAFSKSGTRIAILENDRFSVFIWALKTRPVPVPILESSYPLSDAPNSRPRQIAFINETEVYVLKSSGPNNTCIERTTLETRETKVAYQAADSEQIMSMFASLGHESLWFSHNLGPNHPITYSYISMPSPNQFEVMPWSQSPSAETYWAQAVQISEDEVYPPFRSHVSLITNILQDSSHLYDQVRGSVCQQNTSCQELHFLPSHTSSYRLHNLPTPDQIRPPDESRRFGSPLPFPPYNN